jgi:methylmalonyl-CoA mutase, N-terminal domain
VSSDLQKWHQEIYEPAVKKSGERQDVFETSSEIKLDPVYTTPPNKSQNQDLPGQFPYTRGIHAAMYRSRLWTMRQYAGFGDAKGSNERYRYLLDQGQTGLSVAFDLPTQMGFDSDHPQVLGEVGKVGVAIDSLVDMEILFDQIPLDKVSTSMTINATASTLLCLYLAVARKQGVAFNQVRGTIQNDILKEYMARGTYIYPPRPSMRLVTDIFSYCHQEVPKWNTISISGYHIREAGCTAAQEIGFTLADGIAYVQAAVDAGLNVDDFGPRLAFFFNVHNQFFEEVAKFRAARRMWANIMQKRFKAKNPKSWMLRFHSQTAGSTLTAQQPENNIVRVALQALAAAMGGTQSLHTNSMDEALGLPTQEAARIALRTQQVLAHETGVADVADPMGGSYLVEHLTDELEKNAQELIQEIDDRGGMVVAIEEYFPQRAIEEAAYRAQLAQDSSSSIVVGVNSFMSDSPTPPLLKIDPKIEEGQRQTTAEVRASRSQSICDQNLQELHKAAAGADNVMPCILRCVENLSTLGEIADVMRHVFGEHRPVHGGS